jgi:hypothetical protein
MNNKPVIRFALSIAIIIVLNLFFNFAIKLVYDAPEWNQFCKQEQVTIQPENQAECVARGGAWSENVVPKRVASEPAGWCDLNFSCQKEFESVNEVYNRNVFVALVILGLASFVVGFWLISYAAVSTGLSLGGVVSFLVGTIRYWSSMDDYLRVIILGLVLVALIWLGIKKLNS